ncbi:MAG: hypothetical protein K2O06_07895 [Acetatifactor sp.]|nr:hypothetical protein [Acetatifactor sp.]
MSIKDEYFIEWQKTVTELCMIFRKVEKMISPNTMLMVWQSAFVGLYMRNLTKPENTAFWEVHRSEIYIFILCF